MRIMLPVVLTALLTACVGKTNYYIEVDSYTAQGAIERKNYILLPADKTVDKHSLQYKKLEHYLNKALEQEGYKKVFNVKEADLALMFKFGVSQPNQKIGSYYVPNLTGGAGSHGTVTYTEYKRFFQIDAIDMPEYMRIKQNKPIWTLLVESTGRSNDLRLVFPYMVVASKPYFGKDTGVKKRVVLGEGDKKVSKFIEASE